MDLIVGFRYDVCLMILLFAKLSLRDYLLFAQLSLRVYIYSVPCKV